MQTEEPNHFYPPTRQAWREWLQENHDKQQFVWVIFYKKHTGVPSISWSEAVDEALCFGWIDSTSRPIDVECFRQYFTRRKPGSTWSKINKEKIKQLTADGLMAEAGLAIIEKAKQNGSWTILDEVEELIIPPDLDAAFDKWPGSKDFFLSLSKSVRKMMLSWIVLAKQAETRQKRIDEIAVNAGQKQKPKQF